MDSEGRYRDDRYFGHHVRQTRDLAKRAFHQEAPRRSTLTDDEASSRLVANDDISSLAPIGFNR